jgi:Gas vesicle synthesis protein GvpL/GvpF
VTLIAHAIAPAPHAPVEGEGLRGRPLSWSGAGDIGLWSTHWDPADKLDRSDALEHHRLVERICASQPCLPVRFGTAFATADAARASLASRSTELRAALDRVAGKSELALTLLWAKNSGGSAPRPPDPATGPGRRFMEERRARYATKEARKARADDLVERLIAELPVERSLVWHQTCTSDGVAVSLAVLVPSEQADQRKADLQRLAGGFSDVVGVVNGPWPPYSFASIDESGGSAPRPPTGSAPRPPS